MFDNSIPGLKSFSSSTVILAAILFTIDAVGVTGVNFVEIHCNVDHFPNVLLIGRIPLLKPVWMTGFTLVPIV